jgi:hypothetical protein
VVGLGVTGGGELVAVLPVDGFAEAPPVGAGDPPVVGADVAVPAGPVGTESEWDAPTRPWDDPLQAPARARASRGAMVRRTSAA